VHGTHQPGHVITPAQRETKTNEETPTDFVAEMIGGLRHCLSKMLGNLRQLSSGDQLLPTVTLVIAAMFINLISFMG
jgi:hypothetical protein